MVSILRVAAAVNKATAGDPNACLREIQHTIALLGDSPADLVIFPQLALAPPDSGSLLSSSWLAEGCRSALGELCLATSGLDCAVVVGLPMGVNGRVRSVCAVLHRGQVLGMVPALDQPEDSSWEEEGLLPPETVFACGDLRFCVLPCDPLQLPRFMDRLEGSGCGLVAVPCYPHAFAGGIRRAEEVVATVSQVYGCAVAVAAGGVGNSSSPYLYQGFTAVYECGQKLCGDVAGRESFVSVCDLDCDIIYSQLAITGAKAPFARMDPAGSREGMLRPVSPNPYLAGIADPDGYYDEFFSLQIRSLADRLERTGLRKLVVGISGGLDSTLAALVAARALETLGLPAENLLGITMPGFGTSERTLWNALTLLEGLGAQCREIPIAKAVSQHFADIGHDPSVRDVTYENAQARERTQILLDLANSEGALVVGTGDLSEAALGWCTFGGDQIASYNVNITATKTMVRGIVEVIARSQYFPRLTDILYDILGTPVSPELLPPDSQGAISQQTEDILGPYPLHEFFLYYFVRYGMRPSKIWSYACVAFSGQYTPPYLEDCLRLFIRRFFAGQFKRSCAPDAAVIGEVNLCGVSYRIPSDMDATALLKELDRIHLDPPPSQPINPEKEDNCQ